MYWLVMTVMAGAAALVLVAWKQRQSAEKMAEIAAHDRVMSVMEAKRIRDAGTERKENVDYSVDPHVKDAAEKITQLLSEEYFCFRWKFKTQALRKPFSQGNHIAVVVVETAAGSELRYVRIENGIVQELISDEQPLRPKEQDTSESESAEEKPSEEKSAEEAPGEELSEEDTSEEEASEADASEAESPEEEASDADAWLEANGEELLNAVNADGSCTISPDETINKKTIEELAELIPLTLGLDVYLDEETGNLLVSETE